MTRAFVLMLLLAGCGRDRPQGAWVPVNLFESGSGPRIMRSLQYDTLWMYGQGDTVLASADLIVATPSGDAVVLDVLGQRVHRIGPEGVVWSWGGRGQGPGELQHAQAITVNARGEVVIADSGNRRLVWLSTAGSQLHEVPIPSFSSEWGAAEINGIVSLTNGGYVLDTMGSSRWLRLSERGELEGRITHPWRGWSAMAPLQTYGQVSGGQNNIWVFGFAIGNGFFVFDDEQPMGSYPYVEHIDFPALVTTELADNRFAISYTKRPRTAARDIAMRGDTLFVLSDFGNLDRYAITGRYLDTITLPTSTVAGIAINGNALMYIDTQGLTPAIIAIQTRSDME